MSAQTADPSRLRERAYGRGGVSRQAKTFLLAHDTLGKGLALASQALQHFQIYRQQGLQ